MAREQLGICTEANLHGSYLLLNAYEGHESVLRYKLARIPQLIDRLAAHFSESMLTAVVAIGSNYWDLLYPDARPAGLKAFPDLTLDEIGLSPVPIDLLIQIRSDRLDVNVIACQQILQVLQGHTELQDQIQGFRYLDGRDLSGFINAPYNPGGRHKRQIALVDSTQQPVFAAGSYMYFQQLCFDQMLWQQLSLTEQEEVMGYDKVSAKPLSDSLMLPDSHLASTQQSGSTVLLQNMPFYQPKRQGLIQLSYAAKAEYLAEALFRRLGVSEQLTTTDALLSYYHIELSAAFFAPSLSFLELSAKG